MLEHYTRAGQQNKNGSTTSNMRQRKAMFCHLFLCVCVIKLSNPLKFIEKWKCSMLVHARCCSKSTNRVGR